VDAVRDQPIEFSEMKTGISTPLILALFFVLFGEGSQLIVPEGKLGVVGRFILLVFFMWMAYDAGVHAGKAEK
jgi:hypothetical protein